MRPPFRIGLVLPVLLVACGSGNGHPAPLFTTEVLTRHDGNGYSGVLTVHDGTCALSALSATGTGITGSLSLTHLTNRCDEWKLDVSYGSTVSYAAE